MARTVTSISIIPNSNPITWQTSTAFTVLATYSDGSIRNITDSCTYSMNPTGIVTINGIELWVGTDTWNSSSNW